eukprot:361084-Chlamydomonas_euryale.AAC.4
MASCRRRRAPSYVPRSEARARPEDPAPVRLATVTLSVACVPQDSSQKRNGSCPKIDARSERPGSIVLWTRHGWWIHGLVVDAWACHGRMGLTEALRPSLGGYSKAWRRLSG